MRHLRILRYGPDEELDDALGDELLDDALTLLAELLLENDGVLSELLDTETDDAELAEDVLLDVETDDADFVLEELETELLGELLEDDSDDADCVDDDPDELFVDEDDENDTSAAGPLMMMRLPTLPSRI